METDSYFSNVSDEHSVDTDDSESEPEQPSTDKVRKGRGPGFTWVKVKKNLA